MPRPPVKVRHGEVGEAGGCCRGLGSLACAPYFRSCVPHRAATSVPLCALCGPDSDTDASHKTGVGPATCGWKQVRVLIGLSAPGAGPGLLHVFSVTVPSGMERGLLRTGARNWQAALKSAR